MEGGSRNKRECPQLLDLIHKGRKPWLMKSGGARLGCVDEGSLELRLAPPGEDWSVNQDNKLNQNPKFATLYCSSSHQSQPCATNYSPQKRSAPAPVVGWPPVHSFRKNAATNSSAKEAGDSLGKVNVNAKEERSNKGMFVKINMDGVPIGRKVDLSACNGYQNLSSAVDVLFRDLLAAQRDSHVTGNLDKVEDIKEITGLLDGSGEYTLVYEDNEGDRMLVGDVPWDMFVLTVKRLRVLKTCEHVHLIAGRGGKQRKKHQYDQ